MTAKKTQKKIKTGGTVNAQDVAQFEVLGAKWWDESGPMAPLHRLNPLRMQYIKSQICAALGCNDLKGLKIADIGCGGGLVTEPLYRMGAKVTGIDAGAENIRAAKDHAKLMGLNIDYRATTAEDLAASGTQFDVVTALEIVEHVSDVDLFLKSCAKLVRPGGVLIVSTLNRTAKSFLLGIVAVEYILRWLPAGTHNWKQFLKPSEVAKPLLASGLNVRDVTGVKYLPITRRFVLDKNDLDVNYFLTLRKKV